MERVVGVARRVPYYFTLALLAVGCLAGIQFTLLNVTTGWMRFSNEIPRQRLVALDAPTGRPFAVAAFFAFDRATNPGLDLRLAIISSSDLAEVSRLQPTDTVGAKVSPCGLLMGAMRRDGTVSIHGMGQGLAPISNVAVPANIGRVRSLWWSPDSERLLIVADRLAWLWEREHRRVLREWEVERDAAVAPTDGGETFCLVNKQDCLVLRWEDGSQVTQFPLESQARNVVVSNDASIAAYTWGAELRVIETGSQRSLLKKRYSVAYALPPTLALSADGRRLAFIQVGPDALEHLIRVIELSGEAEIGSYPMGKAFMSGIKFSGDSLWAWTTTGRVNKWDYSLAANDAKHSLERNVWVP